MSHIRLSELFSFSFRSVAYRSDYPVGISTKGVVSGLNGPVPLLLLIAARWNRVSCSTDLIIYSIPPSF